MNIDLEKPNFKKLCFLNMQRLTNFPYIEADFDALTNYELLCKVVEYLNNVIANQNTTNETVEELYDAFITLKNYVDDYFENLDVQDEINNKLDEMAGDGTLTGLISVYLTPIINEQNAEISRINNKVNSVASGAPKAVSTIDDMTDTTKVYVLTTDGYWYYYDGTDWVQGGVYQASQSTDDVKTIGDILTCVYDNKSINGDVIEYENKTMNTVTGVTSNSNNRLFSKYYLPKDITSISLASGYECVLAVFDSTDTFKGVYRTGTGTIEPTSGFTWTNTKLIIPYNLLDSTDNLKLLVKKMGGSQIAISPEDISNISYNYKLLDVVENIVPYVPEDNNGIKNNLYNPSGLTPITYDASFNHNNPINIYKVDNEYTTDFNVFSNKHTEENIVYIAPDGDDISGNGTRANPYKTIEQALSVSGIDTLFLLKGTYYMGTNFSNNIQITQDINIIGDDAELFFGDITTKLLAENGIMRIKSEAFIEGITFNGGRGLIVEASSITPTFYNCKFIHANQNGLNFRGLGCYVVNCEASYNELDGFNYHDYNDIAPTGVIEINSKAHHNGNKSNRSSNGSTIHDNGRIIRLKNEYYLNHGGNLADSESISYNFDIIAHDSTNYNVNESFYNGNFESLFNSTIYLYNCLGSGSIYQLTAYQSSNIYTDHDILSNYKYKDSGSNIYII